MKIETQATILIVPGLRDHVAEHWQTLLQNKLAKVRSVPPLENDKLSCPARVTAIEKTLAEITGAVIIVAHSGGVPMLLHWVQQHHDPARHTIKGALLAAPPDFDTPLPAGYPTLEALRDNGWLPTPRNHLPFRSITAASTNDPLASLSSVEQMARDWGSEVVNCGAVGHLNPASGYGDWPQALDFVQQLDH